MGVCISDSNVRAPVRVAPEAKLNDYALTQVVLGQGMCGKVYAARSPTAMPVALKVFNKRPGAAASADFANEVDFLSSLDHPHVVKFVDFFETKESSVIVTELLDGADLHETLAARECPFDEFETANILQQLLKALSYLHGRMVMHRDVKAENIMISSRHKVKLIDFGLATSALSLDRRLCGSPNYLAPEINSEGYDEKVDVFAAGVCAFLMLTKEFPFQKGEIGSSLGESMRAEASLLSGVRSRLQNRLALSRISSSARDLLKRMMERDPDKRISAAEALKHRFFSRKRDEEEWSTTSPGRSQDLSAFISSSRGASLEAILRF